MTDNTLIILADSLVCPKKNDKSHNGKINDILAD